MARACGYEVKGAVAEDIRESGRPFEAGRDAPVLDEATFLADAKPGKSTDAIALGIGDNAKRWQAYRRLLQTDATVRLLVNLIHPTAAVSSSVAIGNATVVMPMAVINAHAVIHRAVIVNTASVIEHDVYIDDGAHVSPGAVILGGARIGSGAWIGGGAVVLPKVTIGRYAIVGAGAVVIKDVEDSDVVIGVPARPHQ